MSTYHLVISSILCVISGSALAQDTARSDGSTKPQAGAEAKPGWNDADTARALVKLHELDLTEIEAGNLALQAATSDEVKDFAQALVEDHEATV